MLDTVKAKSQAQTATPHPLDPLTAEEITADSYWGHDWSGSQPLAAM